MTSITILSKHYSILPTEHTNELAEQLGYNIAGEEFICDEGADGKEVRGYVMKAFYGNVRFKHGPITLKRSDLQEWS